MINSKKIYNEILSNSKITSIVSEDSILDVYPNEVEEYPCIIFLDSDQKDVEYADNKPTANSCFVDIHIFTKSIFGYPTTSEIGILVSEIFQDNDFVCIKNSDVTDSQIDVCHRVMGFRKEIFSN